LELFCSMLVSPLTFPSERLFTFQNKIADSTWLQNVVTCVEG
jgi:hypothetical protein